MIVVVTKSNLRFVVVPYVAFLPFLHFFALCESTE